MNSFNIKIYLHNLVTSRTKRFWWLDRRGLVLSSGSGRSRRSEPQFLVARPVRERDPAGWESDRIKGHFTCKVTRVRGTFTESKK